MIILGLWFHGWMESHMVHQLTVINNKRSPRWIWSEHHTQQISAVDRNIHCHCSTGCYGRIFCRFVKLIHESCHLFIYLDLCERKHTRQMRCAIIMQALFLTSPVKFNVSVLNSCSSRGQYMYKRKINLVKKALCSLCSCSPARCNHFCTIKVIGCQ